MYKNSINVMIRFSIIFPFLGLRDENKKVMSPVFMHQTKPEVKYNVVISPDVVCHVA